MRREKKVQGTVGIGWACASLGGSVFSGGFVEPGAQQECLLDFSGGFHVAGKKSESIRLHKGPCID